MKPRQHVGYSKPYRALGIERGSACGVWVRAGRVAHASERARDAAPCPGSRCSLLPTGRSDVVSEHGVESLGR
jgi:hypothetical protein